MGRLGLALGGRSCELRVFLRALGERVEGLGELLESVDLLHG